MTDIKRVTILVDNDSWILPHAKSLYDELFSREIDVVLVRDQEDIVPGCICFMLGCTRIVTAGNLAKSRHNLVVHESSLPLGKGFAPMAWQILEDKMDIPICVLEADDEVDSGAIWLKSTIALTGHELCQEWRTLQGKKTVELCIECVERYAAIKPQPQTGESSFYPRRTAKNSELNIHQSVAELFNLLRTVDNEKYPAFFRINGKTYRLGIYQDD